MDESKVKPISEQLKIIMTKKEKTAKDIADTIGLDITKVEKWINGKVMPDAEMREWLFCVLGEKLAVDTESIKQRIKRFADAADEAKLEKMDRYIEALTKSRQMSLPVILSYEQCPKCGFLSSDTKLANPNIPCSHCNSTGDTRVMWPPLELLKILKTIHFMTFLGDREIRDLAVILFVALFEGMLYHLLELKLYKNGKTEQEITIILENKYRFITAKVHYYKELFGVDFKDELERIGFEGFYDDWVAIKKARDDYIHLKNTYLSEEILGKAIKWLVKVYNLFAILNNKYCVK